VEPSAFSEPEAQDVLLVDVPAELVEPPPAPFVVVLDGLLSEPHAVSATAPAASPAIRPARVMSTGVSLSSFALGPRLVLAAGLGQPCD